MSAVVINPYAVVPSLVISVPDCSTADNRGSGVASCSIQFDRAGTVTTSGNGAPGTLNWATPGSSSIGDSYWVRFTKTSESGNPASGTFNSWLQINTGRFVLLTESNDPGASSVALTIDIASDSAGVSIVSTRTGILLESNVGA